MNYLSILNHILGPVIRGPSSSHTAGSFFIGRLARSLLGAEPQAVEITFEASGSYAQVYRQQKADCGFAAGLLGWEITDERFPSALDYAAQSGLDLKFQSAAFPEADHPNFVQLRLRSKTGEEITLKAKSIGGGMVEISELENWPVKVSGDRFDYFFVLPGEEKEVFLQFLHASLSNPEKIEVNQRPEAVFFHVSLFRPMADELMKKIKATFPVKNIWKAPPLMPVASGRPLFYSAAEAISLAARENITLGRLAIVYEHQLLGLEESEIRSELGRRLKIMRQAVASGMRDSLELQLLRPTAHLIAKAEKEEKLAGGMLTRAAARAMAAQHTASSMGVVCAAPTAGSAGTLPGIMVTLLEDRKISEEKAVEALAAAGAVGLIVGYRATFAAEVAGCQVEIGAAGAMGAAAVVEAFGGGAKEAFDAASISFQNTMGSVCDLVQGVCEIPCHTRNAVAAASAFICADLILGGYVNPIPFDETIDAVYEVGKMLPAELKVTSLGGLALCPSALKMKKQPLS
ncbi:MAG: L-serine ammonia-lyase, iron-sulfur-dependent, subunit alpha [Candidatus Aminicenantales bacterium]